MSAIVLTDMRSLHPFPTKFRRALVAALGGGALLLAACGSDDVESHDLASEAAPATTVSATTAAPTSTVPVATVVPRADGLTGAPVPQHSTSSSDVDFDRVNVRAGSFPPLDDPRVVSPAEATWLEDDDTVLGAVQNGEARAYPLFMMTFHHVSNDELGGEPYLVTF